MIKKGILFGLSAGIIISIVDSFFFYKPHIYIPSAYPFLILFYNISMWSTIGLCQGSCLQLFYTKIKRRKDCQYKTLYETLFFLLPFAFIYGIGSKLGSNIKLSNIIFPYQLSPCFDNHLSFIWVLLFLAFLSIHNVKKQKHHSTLFVELIIIISIYNFCTSFPPIIKALDKTSPYITLIYSSGIILIFTVYVGAAKKIQKVKSSPRTIFFFILLPAAFIIISTNYLLNAKTPDRFPQGTTHGKMAKKNHAKGPSVILIVLDTVRADSLSMYINDISRTPNLEKFSEKALLYNNCKAPSPWTLPSHASLFTGLYPVQHGAHYKLKKSTGRFHIPDPLENKYQTLSEIFYKNGYTTALNASNPIFSSNLGLNQGFEIINNLKGIGTLYIAPFKPLFHVFCAFTGVLPKYFLFYRTAEDINKTTCNILGKINDKPLFLFINYMDAHAPYSPEYAKRNLLKHFQTQWAKLTFLYHQKFNNLYKDEMDHILQSLYHGEIGYLDRQLGSLFAKLKKQGLYDPSLIVVTSDHGELLGEHGYYYHKVPMYEGVLHIPLLIKFPFSRITGDNQTILSLQEVFKMILKECSLDLSPKNNIDKNKLYLVSEFFHTTTGTHRVIFDETYKYMEYENKKPELYNYRQDPLEQFNLIGTETHLQNTLKKKLEMWKRKHEVLNENKNRAGTNSKDIEEALRALGYIK